MANKYAEIVHPRGCEDHVVIKLRSFADKGSERIESWLVTEFVFRARFCADVNNDRLAPIFDLHSATPNPQSNIGQEPAMFKTARGSR
jgi:hypothetical protein